MWTLIWFPTCWLAGSASTKPAYTYVPQGYTNGTKKNNNLL